MTPEQRRRVIWTALGIVVSWLLIAGGLWMRMR